MDADKLWEKANRLIPGGSHLLSKNKNLFSPEKWPTYYKKAKGVYTWDLSGKRYIDFASNGIGACSRFGNKSVDRYVMKTIDLGVMSSLNAPEEVELAERLIELHPGPKWLGLPGLAGKRMQSQ